MAATESDLNPTENLWSIIKRRRQNKFGIPKTKEELEDQVFDIWNGIEPNIVTNLSDSFLTRMKGVLPSVVSR